MKTKSFFDVTALDSTSALVYAQADTADIWQKECIHPCGDDSCRNDLGAYDGVLQADSKDVLAWLDKGERFCDLDKDDHAYECFYMAVKLCDESLVIDPEDADAWWYKAEGLQGLEMFKEAADAYDKIIELHPDDLDAWLNKALVLQQLGMDCQAVEAFEKAIKLIPRILDHSDSMNSRCLGSNGLKDCTQASDVDKGGL